VRREFLTFRILDSPTSFKGGCLGCSGAEELTMTHTQAIPSGRVSKRTRAALRAVLDKIRDCSPDDFKRIRRVVREILPLTAEEVEGRTQGEWRALHCDPDDPETWGYGIGETPGTMFVNEDLPEWRLKTVIAHELGHACTVIEDRDRTAAPSDEWASEAAADRYAYKWGFGQLIARDRRTSDWTHHGAKPGKEISVEMGGELITWKLTRDFRYRQVKPVKAKRKEPPVEAVVQLHNGARDGR